MPSFAFSYYRIQVVDGPVNILVIGPDGRVRGPLSQALSFVARNASSPKYGDSLVAKILWAFNVLAAKLGVDPAYDPADRFAKSLGDCRVVLFALMAALNVSSKDAEERDGSVWLSPKAHMHAKVADLVVGLGLATFGLAKIGLFGGQDPGKVDPAVSRTGGKRRILVSTRRGLRQDTDNILRLRDDRSVAPRIEDPRFYDRLKRGLELTGAREAIMLACDLGRFAGGRSMSILPLNMFDVLVLAKERGRFPSRNKGGDADDRSFVMSPGTRVTDAIFAYIDGERARLTGESLARLRLIAADPAKRHELKSRPLLTLDGRNPVTYDQLYRAFRKAAEKMDLYVDDDEYRETLRKRFVTFHWLRHEYVHSRLDSIDAMDDPERERKARRRLVTYMCWKHDRMLAWYSAHHSIKLAERAADEHNDELDRTIGAAALAPVAPLADDQDFDTDLLAAVEAMA